jgi:hypothetical protein
MFATADMIVKVKGASAPEIDVLCGGQCPLLDITQAPYSLRLLTPTLSRFHFARDTQWPTHATRTAWVS